MDKREKVINGLKTIVDEMEYEVAEWVNYSDSELNAGLTVDCDWWLDALGKCKDALELLKAQEPREPHYTKLEYIVNGMPVAINHPECPRCYDNGLVLWDAEIEKGAAYCKRCGQAVKWG